MSCQILNPYLQGADNAFFFFFYKFAIPIASQNIHENTEVQITHGYISNEGSGVSHWPSGTLSTHLP